MLFAAISNGAIIGFLALVFGVVLFVGLAALEKANDHDAMMECDKRFIQRSHVQEVEALRPYDQDKEIDNLISFDPFHGMKKHHPSNPGFTPKDA